MVNIRSYLMPSHHDSLRLLPLISLILDLYSGVSDDRICLLAFHFVPLLSVGSDSFTDKSWMVIDSWDALVDLRCHAFDFISFCQSIVCQPGRISHCQTLGDLTLLNFRLCRYLGLLVFGKLVEMWRLNYFLQIDSNLFWTELHIWNKNINRK